ncbi:MAG: hypothetical protein HY238_01505 [Acidobacteria bacterium]|nr:hypothetical protein [Acidobacteriota bacterium]
MVPYLAENRGRKLYAIDWGFSDPVQFVGARWKLNVDDFFFALNTPPGPEHAEAVKKLGELMRDPRNLFLLHSPQRTFYPTPAQEFFALAGSGIEMRPVAVFQERSGEITYEVYQQAGAPVGPGAALEIPVLFTPQRVAPKQEYAIEVREFPNSWIDVVYQLERSPRATATRFCRLDAQGRARITVPADHPAATVRVIFIRASGGEWRPAHGSITVVR